MWQQFLEFILRFLSHVPNLHYNILKALLLIQAFICDLFRPDFTMESYAIVDMHSE